MEEISLKIKVNCEELRKVLNKANVKKETSTYYCDVIKDFEDYYFVSRFQTVMKEKYFTGVLHSLKAKRSRNMFRTSSEAHEALEKFKEILGLVEDNNR